MWKNNYLSKLDNKLVDDAMKDFNIIDENYWNIKDERMILIMSCTQYEIQQALDNIKNRNIIH